MYGTKLERYLQKRSITKAHHLHHLEDHKHMLAGPLHLEPYCNVSTLNSISETYHVQYRI